MSQFVGPNQSSRLGRGQRPQVKIASKIYARVRRLPRPDHHRGSNPFRRDGRLVQPGKEVGQVQRVRRHSIADQRRNQGRGKGLH